MTAGRLEDAEALARRAVALAGETDWSNDHAAAWIALGEVLRERGRLEEAGTAIRQALTLYEEKGNVVVAEEVHALLARLVPA